MLSSQPEVISTANYTPLSESVIQKAGHAKNRALDAWRRVISSTRKQKTPDTYIQVPEKQAAPEMPKEIKRRGFLAGMAGATLGLLKGHGTAQAAPAGKTQSRAPQEGIAPEGDVHILTSADYLPDNPSPDYLKGQKSGYVHSTETLEDGSKLWPLDWNLSPIDPADMVYNLPGQRSPGSFRAVVHHLNLGHPQNGRYAKVEDVDRTITFCNVAASDMADMFQVSHIFSRFDENGSAMLANAMNDRLIQEAGRSDRDPQIELISRGEAQAIADMGYPVFLSIKKVRKTPNADWMNGHIGLVTPRPLLDKANPEHSKQGLYLVQAGSESGEAVFFDEREKYTEENGYLHPIFAIDVRDLKDARIKDAARKALQEKVSAPTSQ